MVAAPKPQRPQMDSEPSGQRDTPTEMYVKGAHDGPDLASSLPGGERNTPTSAFRADEDLPDRGAFLRTLQSPSGLSPADPGPRLPAPRFGGPAPGEEGAANAWAEGGMQAPTLDPRSLGAIPPARLSSPNLGGTQPLTPLREEPLPGPVAKPAWQVSLDKALVRAGHLIEENLKRFRAAPQSTQLAITIGAGAVVLLILILFLVLVLL
jgi:hypothetical protein